MLKICRGNYTGICSCIYFQFDIMESIDLYGGIDLVQMDVKAV